MFTVVEEMYSLRHFCVDDCTSAHQIMKPGITQLSIVPGKVLIPAYLVGLLHGFTLVHAMPAETSSHSEVSLYLQEIVP